jgi:hypothetical protein
MIGLIAYTNVMTFLSIKSNINIYIFSSLIDNIIIYFIFKFERTFIKKIEIKNI